MNKLSTNHLTLIYNFLISDQHVRNEIFAKKNFCFKLNFYSNIKEYLNL